MSGPYNYIQIWALNRTTGPRTSTNSSPDSRATAGTGLVLGAPPSHRRTSSFTREVSA